ncbi:sodium:proton antiporter [Candidatus Acetothermia bacterium]|nr:sodium:proton antiporter [Candidatus Acetothermia bacterium]
MENASVEVAKHWLFILAIVLTTGMVVGRIAQFLRVPDVVLFLLAGIAIGPSVLSWISVPSESTVNQLILVFGASYILFDGGASLSFRVLKSVGITVVLLATLGVLVTAGVTGVAAHFFLSLPWISAFLLAAVIASTDPATIIPVFKQIKIRERLTQTVISESAFNDATGAILTFTLLGVITGGNFSLAGSLAQFSLMVIGGLVAGAVFGYLAAFLIAHEKYSFLMEFAPLTTVVVVAGAYLAADGINSSGFMAVFVFGAVLGNADMLGFKMKKDYQERMHEFIQVTALASRMIIFILLGSQVDFGLVGQYVWTGLGVIFVFMLIARPLTVFTCALPDRIAKWTWQELLCLCWTRETGVIPAALAGLLLGQKIADAKVIASITFLAVAATILVQAPTTRFLAQRLGLLEDTK